MEHPESHFTFGTAHDTIALSEREKGKNMWMVFEKATGKVVKEGLACEVDCEMWIAAQTNAEELAYAPF